MGWFEEQIRQRVAGDEEAFARAFEDLAGVVTGGRLPRELEDKRTLTMGAIAEILKYYGEDLREVPEEIADLDEQLEYLLRPTGIMRRTVRLEGAWYKDAVGALLGVVEQTGTPVALMPGKFGGYSYVDAQTGKRVKVDRRTAARLAPEAVCFYRPLPLKRLGLGELARFIVRTLDGSDAGMCALATLAVTCVGLILPKLNNLIYDQVLQSGSLRLLVAAFAFLLGATLARTMLNGVRTLVVNRVSGKLEVAVQAAGMMRLLSLPASFFKTEGTGKMAARLSYINTLCKMLVEVTLGAGMTSVFSLAYIVQMGQYGPGLVIPGLTVIALTVGISTATIVAQIRLLHRRIQAEAKESGVTLALIGGVQKIRLAGAEKRAFAKWAGSYRPAAMLRYNPPALVKLSGVITTSLSLIGSIVIYAYTIRTQVSLADYYAFNTAYAMVTGAFTSLLSMAGVAAEIRPVLEMVRPILEAQPEMERDRKTVTRLSGGVELNNVTFRYEEDGPAILDDLTLKIRPGQYVAIVGRTGCGKSTLMRILLGFETPQKGAVYYDGEDINALDLKSLRRNIGTVMQNAQLFQGSIYSNIVISAPWLDIDRAWEAAELAGIAQDIRDMPMGMHTVIAEGSGGISGGQRQRLVIARAIAPRPRILMLDEATSALDNLTQKKVSDSLESLKCTRVVIAHRLSTIRHCDRIIVLDKGRIVEDGDYDALIARGGFFAELVARQRLDEGAADANVETKG